MNCQIQWVDSSGNPTPDCNPAIGFVRTIARDQLIHGRNVRFQASQWFAICEHHAKRLAEPGMEIWAYSPAGPGCECSACA